MKEELTKSDVEKIEKEIEYRKLVVRKEGECVYVDNGNGEGYYIVIKKIVNTSDDSNDRIRRV